MLSWKKTAALALGLLMMLAETVYAAQVVSSVRMNRGLDGTRIVFLSAKPIEHHVFKLDNPARIVLDLHQVDLQFDLGSLDFGNGPIREVRVGKPDSDVTRVVFDLRAPARPSSFQLTADAEHQERLVLDVKDGAEPAATTSSVAAPAPGSAPRPPVAIPAARPMIVAIDAGHGGQDPGAIGPSGTREKDVVLQIARRIAARINSHPGMKAVLIRDGDYYIPLADRRIIAAERHKADLFISVHADAFTNNKARGASIFALSLRGATSAEARFLASVENDSDRVAGVLETERNNSSLLSVIANMVTEGAVTHSIELSKMILAELQGKVTLHGNRVYPEQAGFEVLKQPGMMSILLETGFLSNREEERLLKTAAHQEKLAKAVLDGTVRYFQTHPQPDTWFARNRGKGLYRPAVHRIARGETLSSIARRYEVTEAQLKSLNGLKSDVIRVGQELKIPAG